MPPRTKTVSRKSPRRPARKERPAGSTVADILLEISEDVEQQETLDGQLETLVRLFSRHTGAERGSLFLNDPSRGELYSRVLQGEERREIRILNTSGIAGDVFRSGEAVLVHDASSDPRFSRAVDEITGFVTRNILCVPIHTRRGETIGVAQVVNKKKGRFTRADLALLGAMALQASAVLQASLLAERMHESQKQEERFLEIVAEASSEIKLRPLLQLIITTIQRMLGAERSTLFLHDERTHELYTEIGEGLESNQIRFPDDRGIAGAVFSTRRSVNIPYAYADLRFNPAIDRQSGFFTRSILCVPLVNKSGRTIGVTQVLNKRGGSFTDEDEKRLKAFTAQIAIGLENAKLFDDVQRMRDYSESILESMTNCVLTLDEESHVVTCNRAGRELLGLEDVDILGQTAARVFPGKSSWIPEKIAQARESQKPEVTLDAEVELAGERRSVNATILPLRQRKRGDAGTLVLLEDISKEKRMRSTMSRYMDAGIAEKLLSGGEEVLGGRVSEATVLFSDIRKFTTLTEELGAQGTVGLLNEYFTRMVECIQTEEGMLDKFIGDAIMAVFGVPFTQEDDADRAVRAALAMLASLDEYNRLRLERALSPIEIGIGLNTDEVVSGNIGSPRRMDYTVIGDGVNLASRLESATKQYGVRLIASDLTFKKLKAVHRTRELDRVIVKGKTAPVAIHEILDSRSDPFPHVLDVLGNFRDGLELYRKRQWDRARKKFEAALGLHPGDVTSRLYVERCRKLEKSPPGEDWDGVWTLTEK